MGFFEIFSTALAVSYEAIPSYGIAIVLLTLVVRVLLLPLSIKQSHSMREMQALRPEIKKLQTKHKGDKQKLNEELMKLYKEHGANPLSGCLPMLAQFPVLIGLFYVIRDPLRYLDHIKDWSLPTALAGRDTALSTNSFLGLRLDCTPGQVVSGEGSATLKDAVCGSGAIDAFPYLLLILLMGFTTYYQTKQMQAKGPQDDAQAKQAQMMGKLMPIIFVVFGFQFPTGVVLYWNITNAWQIVQQRIILGGMPDNGPRQAAATASGSPTDKPATSKPAKGSAGSPANPSRPASGAAKPHPSSKKKKKRR